MKNAFWIASLEFDRRIQADSHYIETPLAQALMEIFKVESKRLDAVLSERRN